MAVYSPARALASSPSYTASLRRSWLQPPPFSPSLSMLRIESHPIDLIAADSPSARAYGPEKRLRKLLRRRANVDGPEMLEVTEGNGSAAGTSDAGAGSVSAARGPRTPTSSGLHAGCMHGIHMVGSFAVAYCARSARISRVRMMALRSGGARSSRRWHHLHATHDRLGENRHPEVQQLLQQVGAITARTGDSYAIQLKSGTPDMLLSSAIYLSLHGYRMLSQELRNNPPCTHRSTGADPASRHSERDDLSILC